MTGTQAPADPWDGGASAEKGGRGAAAAGVLLFRVRVGVEGKVRKRLNSGASVCVCGTRGRASLCAPFCSRGGNGPWGERRKAWRAGVAVAVAAHEAATAAARPRRTSARSCFAALD